MAFQSPRRKKILILFFLSKPDQPSRKNIEKIANFYIFIDLVRFCPPVFKIIFLFKIFEKFSFYGVKMEILYYAKNIYFIVFHHLKFSNFYEILTPKISQKNSNLSYTQCPPRHPYSVLDLTRKVSPEKYHWQVN